MEVDGSDEFLMFNWTRLGDFLFILHLFNFFRPPFMAVQSQKKQATVDERHPTPVDKLRLTVYLMVYKVLYTSQVVVWDFFQPSTVLPSLKKNQQQENGPTPGISEIPIIVHHPFLGVKM